MPDDLELLLATPASLAADAVRHRQPPPSNHDSALLASVYRHPQANREVLLQGVQVDYHFAHGQRRTIGMEVDTQGLQVRAPRWVSQAQVHAVLQRKASWILSKLQVQPAPQPPPEPWGVGSQLRVLNRDVLLQSTGASAGSRVSAQLRREEGASVLTLGLNLPQGDARWPQAVQGWLQHLAQCHFTRRLDHFAPQMRVQWQRLSLSNARTRWGSACSQGTIRLHWRLIQLSPELVDYVVVHELAHLREMNHSERFWAVVREHMPDYEARRAELKQVRLTALSA